MFFYFFFIFFLFLSYFLFQAPLSSHTPHFSHPFPSIFSLFLHLSNPSHLPSRWAIHLPCPVPTHLFLHLPPAQATRYSSPFHFFFLSSSTPCWSNSPTQMLTHLSSATCRQPKPRTLSPKPTHFCLHRQPISPSLLSLGFCLVLG